MRRDLAVARERTGETRPAGDDPAPVPLNKQASEPAEQQKPDDEGPKKDDDVVMIEDVSMADVQADEPAAAETAEVSVEASDKKSEDPTAVIKSEKEPTPESKTSPKATEANDEKPPEPPLQIDTQAQAKPTAQQDGQQTANDEAQPDTGTFSNTNDLDSLFGGPTSAGVGDAQEFTMDDSNPAGDFDFGSFINDTSHTDADNDNISSLLPGLQDYANEQPGGNEDPDFDAIFSDLPVGGDGQGDSSNAMDATLDELMDFADFTGNDDSGQTNNNNNQDFDFDFT